MMQLVLSLFPGIGLLDMAFEEEGFCIVRGPDLLWGGDIKRFHPPAGNVPNAKRLSAPNYTQTDALIQDAWCGGETRRLRRFGAGYNGERPAFFVETMALHRPDPENTVLASGGAPDGYVPTARHRATRKGKSVIGFKTEAFLKKAIRLQGLPPDFLSKAPFTVAAKVHAIGNGVPLAMGRAVAKAVKKAIDQDGESVELTDK